MSNFRLSDDNTAHPGAPQAARDGGTWAKASGTVMMLLGASVIGCGAYIGLTPSPLPLSLTLLPPETMALCLFALGTVAALAGAMRIYRAFED